MISFLIGPWVAALLTATLIKALLRWGTDWAVDIPNERSLHARPTPRVGGLALMGTGLLLTLPRAGGFDPILWGAALLCAFSFLDDRAGLPVAVKFSAHLIVACGVLLFSPPAGSALVFVFSIGVVVWGANLFNFMDGSDGLAGGMAMIGFFAMGAAAFLGGDRSLAATLFLFGGAAAGFLWFNFHPARIFMGDAGSIPLGFLGAVWGMEGVKRGLWSPLFPVMVFSPFVFDTTVTLVRRCLKGEPFWMAHKTHYYQRLIQMGWGHRRTALTEYALMGVAALLALLFLRDSTLVSVAVFGIVATLAGILMFKVDQRWRRQTEGR